VLLYLGTHYKSPLSPAGAHFLRQETISKLQSLLAETTAYFTVTVVISCFARLLQTPTIYEIVLIPAVMGFEVYLQTMHILASLSIPPPNTQQPISPRDWGWMEQNRSIAIHTVYIVVNVIVLVLAQIIGFSERGLLIIFNIAKRCDAYASLPAYRLMSSQFLRGHLDLIVNNVSFSLPPWVLIIWLLLCRTQLGARLAAAFPRETTPRGHIDTSSSMCSGAKRSSAGASGCLRVGDFLSYRNSFRTLYRNGNIVLQAILILGVHLTRWYFLYLYCICSMMVVTILHATLDPIFRRWISMPRFYSHIVSQANHCDQWVETLAVDYRLIGVPRLIFATIFIWPIVDTVSWFMYISNMRLMLHKQSQGTDMQNEWGVGQVAAVIAWLPLLTKIIVLGYNRWRSQSKSSLPYVVYIYINHNSVTPSSLRL